MEDYLKKLLELLKLEQEEDHAQYREEMIKTPLKERKQKGISWHPVDVKAIEFTKAGKLKATFERRTHQGEQHRFQTGDSVSVFGQGGSESEQLNGVVTSVWIDQMEVSFQVDEFPDWMEDLDLGIDRMFDSVTYREMEKAVFTLLKGENKRAAQLLAIFHGGKEASFRREPDYSFHQELNSSQQQAIKKAIAAHDVAVIHGPPGTGKTTTLVQAIKLVTQSEKQVLVTAPSNTAVDVLTEKLAEKGLKVIRIGNPARIDENLWNHSLENQLTSHPDAKKIKKLRKQAEEFRGMARKYKRKFGKEEREQRRLLFQEAKNIHLEANRLEEYILEKLLNEVQVITATLVGANHYTLEGRTFSTVFIDEAGQALEPATWIPILKSERVIFAGDHLQLPPTVKSMKAAKGGLEISLLEKVAKLEGISSMLDTQYRMNERIMGFSSEQFYQGKLQAAEPMKSWLVSLKSNETAAALEFIDTAGCGFEESADSESSSKSNRGEAELLMKRLQQLSEEILLPNEGSLSIGVISPYRGQVNLLKELAAEVVFPENVTLQTQTVDGFQGQEKDVIFISLVRSNEEGKIGFLKDYRRMNVALTRARKKLVVIGDSAILANDSFYQEWLTYAETHEAYRSAWELMY